MKRVGGFALVVRSKAERTLCVDLPNGAFKGRTHPTRFAVKTGKPEHVNLPKWCVQKQNAPYGICGQNRKAQIR
jgi:hypothetical protein